MSKSERMRLLEVCMRFLREDTGFVKWDMVLEDFLKGESEG